MTRLKTFAADVTSQNGEDGMINELFRRLGVSKGWCVEFGAWDGEHLSNTWALWNQQGWSALLIEGDPHRCQKLSESTAAFPDVITKEAFVSADGPNSLDVIFSSTSIPKDFDLLSVDIDSDDYRVWEGLKNYQPKVVVIEYNASFGTEVRFVQQPGEHAGSSALSMLELAHTKGYALVALTETNLVLVRRELLARIDIEEVQLADEFNIDLRVVAYSDFGGRHHLVHTGQWGYAGIDTGRSALKAKYHAAGKKVYRKLGKFPAVQNAILKRADPSAYSNR
jgi:hypothetical protein